MTTTHTTHEPPTNKPEPQTYDEVTFALYFDHELDQIEETRFEAALTADEALHARYDEWANTHYVLNSHFEALESNYALDGFTERVMGALPEIDSLTTPVPAKAERELMSLSDRLKQALVPFLIGSLAAAALFVVLGRQITHPNGGDARPGSEFGESFDGLTPISNEEGPTWLESDDEEDDDGEGGGI